MSFNRDAYLMHYNHNHDKLGRFARSIGSAGGKVGSSVLSSGKKKKAPPKADIKSGKTKGSKSNNTKLSKSDRDRIVNSGSVKEVSKYKDMLSNRELETAVNRLQNEKVKRMDIEQKLSDLNNPENAKKKKDAITRLNDMSNTLNKFANTVENGTKAYNVVAKIHNARNPGDTWPIVGEKSTPESSRYAKYLMNEASAEEVWANKKKLNTDEKKKANNRLVQEKAIYERMQEERERNKEAFKKEYPDAKYERTTKVHAYNPDNEEGTYYSDKIYEYSADGEGKYYTVHDYEKKKKKK